MTDFGFGWIGQVPTMGQGRPAKGAREAYKEILQPIIRFMEQQHMIAGQIPRKVRSWAYTFEQEKLIDGKDDFDKLAAQLTNWREHGYIDYRLMSEDDDRELHNAVDWFDDFDTDRQRILRDAFNQLMGQDSPWAMPFNPWQDQDTFVILGSEKSDVVKLLASGLPNYIPYFGCGGQTDVHSRVKILKQCKEALDSGKDVKILYVGDMDPVGLKICGKYCNNDDVVNAKGEALGLLKNMQRFEYAADCVGVTQEIEVVRLGIDLDWCIDNNIPLITKLLSSNGVDQTIKPDFVTKEYIKRYGVNKAECNAMFAKPREARAWIQQIIWQYIDEDIHNNVITKNREFQAVTDKQWQLIMDTMRSQINIQEILNNY
jgi:hypothetical protein